MRRLSASTDQPRLNTGAKASGAVVFNSFTGPKKNLKISGTEIYKVKLKMII